MRLSCQDSKFPKTVPITNLIDYKFTAIHVFYMDDNCSFQDYKDSIGWITSKKQECPSGCRL